MTESPTIGEILAIKEAAKLTHKTKNGAVFTRQPEVESEIEQILRINSAEFGERLEIADAAMSDYISEECLVFLLRAAIAGQNGEIADAAANTLLARSMTQIRVHVRKFAPRDNFDEAVGEIVAELFVRLCDTATDAADYAQARFRRFLKYHCWERLKKLSAHHKRAAVTDSIDGDESLESVQLAAPPEDFSALDWRDARKRLFLIPEPQRTAFVLRHRDDWQIESKEPNEPSLSRHFGVSDRTIRNWLTKAAEILSGGESKKQ